MADEEPTTSTARRNEAWAIKLGSPEWTAAIRACCVEIERRHRGRSDADDLANDAVVEASRTFEGRNGAEFSTLAVTIALRMATRGNEPRGAAELSLDLAAPEAPTETDRGDVELPRGSVAAMGRALDRFFKHEKMMVESLMFRERAVLVRHLRGVLSCGGLLEQALRDEGLHALPIRFRDDFDARLLAYVDRVLSLGATGGWVESAATLDEPLRIVGRRPPDPYAHRHDRTLPREAREGFEEMRRRHAGLIFDERREEVALSICRYAMKLANIDGELVHRALSARRAAETVAAKAKEKRLHAIIDAAEKARSDE